MKLSFLKSLIILSLYIVSTTLQGQSSKSHSANDVYKSAERDSLQLWFYDRATVMGVEGKKRDEFYNIILYHTFKMTRLENRDKGFTSQEIRVRFEKLLQKQHSEVKEILDSKQYNYYLDTYDRLLKGVYERKGWK